MNDKPIDVDATPTQAVALRPAGEIAQQTIADLEQAFAMAVRQRELVAGYIKQQLKPGKHFYQQGDQKPSLTKEGAEIILLPHNLAPDYAIVSGPEKPPEDERPYQITVKCVLRMKGRPDSFAGSGIGSAGSEKGFWNKKTNKWEYQLRQKDKYLCHNATLKMAEKSALIAATLNSTAASEFFTQDMEPGDELVKPEPKTEPTPAPKKEPKPLKLATAATRDWMIKELKLGPNEPNAKIGKEYFEKLGQLIETESISDLPLRFVPITKGQLSALANCIANFEAGGDAVAAFEPNQEEDPKPWDKGTKKVVIPPEVEKKKEYSPMDDEADGQPWYKVIVPIPHKGEKRDEYLKHPDTIGSLYEQRHGEDEESQAARQRLWGFVNHFEPKGWTKKNGEQMPPSKSDIAFREALDQFQEWFEKTHPDEKL